MAARGRSLTLAGAALGGLALIEGCAFGGGDRGRRADAPDY